MIRRDELTIEDNRK